MSNATDDSARRWDARYASGAAPDDPHPASVLIDNERHLPGEGDALDLACGRGGNALWLAERGYRVTAWDVSSVAIATLTERATHLSARRDDGGCLQVEVRDVLTHPPVPDSFDVIVVSRFLERTLCPALALALRPCGVLFYQTFTHGLSNPDYLLGENELLHLFPSLNVLWYHEPEPNENGRAEAGLVAQRMGCAETVWKPREMQN